MHVPDEKALACDFKPVAGQIETVISLCLFELKPVEPIEHVDAKFALVACMQ